MLHDRLLAAIVVMACVLAGCGQRPDVPYVPTPEPVVRSMLHVARVGPDDVVYDLGSGDGRIVIAAARDHGARGVGIEIDPELVELSQRIAEQAGVAERVEFRTADLFQSDFSDATVVMMYLMRSVNLRLRPILFEQLAPGTRVVSHSFDMGDWEPDHIIRHAEPRHTVFYWVIPAPAGGVWHMEPAEGASVQLTLRQRHQMLEGTLQTDQVTRRGSGRMTGQRISLILPADNDAGHPRMELEAEVDGQEMRGRWLFGGRSVPMVARRTGATP